MGKRSTCKKALWDTPDISDSQCICRIKETRGGGLFEVEGGNPQVQLVSLPSRFQKQIWIKRNSFVIIEPCVSHTKVDGEIINILLPRDIKHLQSQGLWYIQIN